MAINTLSIKFLSISLTLLLLSACTATKPVNTTASKNKPSVKHYPEAQPLPTATKKVVKPKRVAKRVRPVVKPAVRTRTKITRTRARTRARTRTRAYATPRQQVVTRPRTNRPVAHAYRAQPKPKYNPFSVKLALAAVNRTRHNIRYDGRYFKIGYPWGDVPQNIGVCTDVVIRSYRKLGIDLQQQVHRDMNNNFSAYPNLGKWKLKGPDTNIDHRRVYNLRVFLARHAQSLPRSRNPAHYQPGDLVTWQLGPGQGHIGIVSNQRSKVDPNRFLVVHNIAEGPKLEDVLFSFPMSGHFRYSGKMKQYRQQYTKYQLPKTLPTNTATTTGLLNIPSELLR